MLVIKPLIARFIDSLYILGIWVQLLIERNALFWSHFGIGDKRVPHRDYYMRLYFFLVEISSSHKCITFQIA